MRMHSRGFALFSLLAVALTSAACVDEEIVFRDRELFEELPSAAGEFVGYTDEASKLTVCGNCHVGSQSEWEESGHADAWAGLQDSGHSQEFCEGCHTVSEFGNAVSEAAGYTTTEDERYHDVQCESCHGPGLAHVENPDDPTIPNAFMTLGPEGDQGCGECHQGAHHPFVEQWEASAHGNVTGFAAARDGCKSCHSGNGALVAWGVNATYAEEGETFDITCGVCHDPHANTTEGQLRFPVGGVAVEDNLCSQCHNRRTQPDPESSHGLHPHSPETGLLIGDVGWFPPGLNIDRRQIVGSHGSERNERLCATCHVSTETITDDVTGEFQFEAVGHSFNAIPCFGPDGVPTTEDCELTVEARSYQGCTGSGCHESPEGTVAILLTSTTRLQFLSEELHDLLVAVDAGLEEPGGEIDATDGLFTVAEGAYFNLELAEFGGTDRPSALLAYAAAASHNPFLTEQLLIASIRAVENEYGVAAVAPASSLTPQLQTDGF
jgi:predicted CXXCH cytochrome family protein